MNAQDLLDKCKSFPLASTTALVTIVLIAVIYVRGTGHDDLENEYNAALQEWDQIEANVFKNSVNLETHLETAKTISQDVKTRLVRPSELAKNFQYFYRLESATNVDIRTLQQEPPAPPAKAKSDDEKKEKPLFSKVGYTMSSTGDYHEMLAFLYALEHGDHFYHLNDFSLARSSEPENQGKITITMNFDLLGTP